MNSVRIACMGNNIGDCIRENHEEMLMMESSRRMLNEQGDEYISYSALGKDSVPCSRPGNSYYNCAASGQANPYHRGCSAITQCARA